MVAIDLEIFGEISGEEQSLESKTGSLVGENFFRAHGLLCGAGLKKKRYIGQNVSYVDLPFGMFCPP